MKGITVKQPWAWAIIHGGKDVENRSQMFSYRGPLLIHAAKVDDSGGYGDARIRALGEVGMRMPKRDDRGHVIGVVDLVDVHSASDYAACAGLPSGYCSRWAESGYRATHLVLRNVRCLAEPVPARGMLGLWDVPEDVAAAVRAQIGGAS